MNIFAFFPIFKETPTKANFLSLHFTTYTQPQKKRTTKIFKKTLLGFFLGQNSFCTIDCWLENLLKKQNKASVTSVYVQMASFITLGCEQQYAYFPALLIKNQGVIENLEQNRPENRNIDSVT